VVAVPMALCVSGACQRSARIETQRVWMTSKTIQSLVLIMEDDGSEDLRTCHRVLVLVDQVLGDVLCHELISFFWHPRVYERGEVERGRAIELEFVVDELVRGFGFDSL
jgi:hypothetical protein